VNIALEGMMIVGALAGAIVTFYFHSPWFGVLAAALAGGGLALVYALVVIRLRADQIVAGTAMNMLAFGMAPFACKILFGNVGSSPGIPLEDQFVLTPVFGALLLVPLVHLWFSYTPSGLWVKFAGEHPHALDAAGVRVNRVRWAAVFMSGILAGLGGATLSICLSSSYSGGMTAGRGYIALAALIFGSWRPIPTALACLLFGLFKAMEIRLQGVVLWGDHPVPVQLIEALPYLLTVLALAGIVGRSRAPKALGIPYRSGGQ
jgi:simple sugar transport system permease protein